MKNLQENISLAAYTTFKIGGPAKYFLVAENNQDLVRAIGFVKEKSLPFFILGGGSNILVSDNGFEGLIIKIQNSKLNLPAGKAGIKNSKIIVDAGVKLGDLVKFSIENNLTGLEWAIGIPGTVGGAVKVNASAFGFNISDLVKDIKKQNNIIISVELELNKGNKQEGKKLIKEYIKKRKETQPLNYPSAGCIFKNPPEKFAGQLIDQAGLKGTKINQVMISDKHANFIVNLGGAKSEDVIKLIKLVKQTVKEKYNVDLQEEIEYLGRFV